jgi:PAS domain S-box-containing protein
MQNDLVKFFNKIEMGSLLSDHHLCIEYANPTFCKLLNTSEDQLIGKKICDILPLSEQSLKENGSMTMEIKIDSCTSLKVFIVKDSLDEKLRYLFLCTDNTFYNKLQEDINILKSELQTSEAIFDNFYEGICITDDKGRTVYVNQAFEELSGVKSEEILGLTGYDMMERNLQTNSCSDIIAKTGDQVCVIIKYYKGKRCLATGSPIYLNGILSKIVITLRDLSDLISLEDKLKYTNVLKLRNKENKLIHVAPLSEKIKKIPTFAANSVMTNIFSKAKKISSVNTPVLLLGETGVGKDYLARYIHNESKGIDNPNFVKINCGAIPDNLLESELFGYEAGAFTNASKKGKIGFFELANDGTIFLDEIGDMPLNLQVKLLDVLQEKIMYRIGGIKPILIKARVLAATNVDLERKIEDGSFRQDLFYRLNVITIKIPPLRERIDDIPFYTKYFLNETNQKYNKKILLSSDNMTLLLKYNWPGNIRELRNMIERVVILSEKDSISNNELGNYIISDNHDAGNKSFMIHDKEEAPALPSDISLKDQLDAYEACIIREKLKIYKSLKTTADALGIDSSTLFRKKTKYGI